MPNPIILRTLFGYSMIALGVALVLAELH